MPMPLAYRRKSTSQPAIDATQPKPQPSCVQQSTDTDASSANEPNTLEAASFLRDITDMLAALQRRLRVPVPTSPSMDSSLPDLTSALSAIQLNAGSQAAFHASVRNSLFSIQDKLDDVNDRCARMEDDIEAMKQEQKVMKADLEKMMVLLGVEKKKGRQTQGDAYINSHNTSTTCTESTKHELSAEDSSMSSSSTSTESDTLPREDAPHEHDPIDFDGVGSAIAAPTPGTGELSGETESGTDGMVAAYLAEAALRDHGPTETWSGVLGRGRWGGDFLE